MSSFASSSTLARQIEAGAPADLFISADQKWMDYAADKRPSFRQPAPLCLATARVVVAPKASAQGAITIDEKTDWTSLLKGGRLAVGDPQHVPAGIYAKEALQKLGAWRRCRRSSPRLKTCAVRWRWWSATKRRWGLSMAPMPWPARVKVVGTFPEASHQKVEYPLAIVDGHRNAAVSAFYDYLKGPEASAIFKRYGFTTR